MVGRQSSTAATSTAGRSRGAASGARPAAADACQAAICLLTGMQAL